MRRWICLLTLLLICASLTGCANDQHDSELNGLWRDGYGYNNPNLGRMRSGQAPLNFDGTVSRR